MIQVSSHNSVSNIFREPKRATKSKSRQVHRLQQHAPPSSLVQQPTAALYPHLTLSTDAIRHKLVRQRVYCYTSEVLPYHAISHLQVCGTCNTVHECRRVTYTSWQMHQKLFDLFSSTQFRKLKSSTDIVQQQLKKRSDI